MPLSHLAILAALHGLTEALPVSRSGHGVVARIWLDAGTPAAALAAVLHLGTALALLTAARRRLWPALVDGVRAVARPAILRRSAAAQDALVLAVATAVSLLTDALVTPRVEPWLESPTATGVGLCLTGLALASTALAPRAPVTLGAVPTTPSLPGAVAVGMALGVAAFPGASRVGAALALLLWMGVRPSRAVELAFLLTVPILLVSGARATNAHPNLDTASIVLALVLAFVGASLAAAALRALTDRRRVAALALWTIPLGLATIAYAHALPSPI